MTTMTRPRRKISPWWALGLIPVAAIALTATGTIKLPSPNTASTTATLETATATQSTFRVGVVGNGTLKAVSTLEIKPQLNGTVQGLPSEGQRVSKGELIARLDPTSFERSVENNQLALEKALAQLESTRAGQASSRANQTQTIASAQASLTSAQVEFNTASTTLANQRRLFAAGGVSAQDVRNAEATLEKVSATLASAKVALSTAQNAVSLKANSDTQDVRNLQLAVNQARVQLRNAQADLAKTKIYASASGIVSSVPAQVGSPVTTQSPLFTLLNDARIELPAQIDETEIAKVKLGQRAEVKLDALRGEVFTGKVTRISAKAEVVANIAVFYVTVTLENPQRTLRPGMTGEATLIAREIPNAVLIPKRALVVDGGNTSVNVLEAAATPGKAQKPVSKPVTIGEDDGLNVVIASGLQAGETVVLPSKTAAPGRGLLP